jgi:hypothetical protein
LELPEKFIFVPGVTTASERVPAMSAPVSNQRPGVSVREKFTSFELAELPLIGSKKAIKMENVDTARPLLFRKLMRILLLPLK